MQPLNYSPQNHPQKHFPQAKLAILDFDMTMASTFTPSPRGIDVPKAYKMAIEQELGQSILRTFNKNGGSWSDDPSSIVRKLLPNATSEEQIVTTARIIQAKLDILLGEIGPAWPKPTAGFFNFWSSVQWARKQGEPINTAIISSGHDSFTRKTLEVWGMPRPEEIDAYVTYDMLLAFAESAPMKLIVKPSSFLIDYVCTKWGLLYGVTDIKAIQEAKKRVTFIGDDLINDGGMAKNAGVNIVHLQSGKTEQAWKTFADRLGLEV
ncbi:MAG TPA: HAD hydrolase-like protein [Candidatus Limnocylindria bacterium]|nr:HAD hydrolase-like protein [Candidatus Limnocylindria bacterium]